MDQFKRIISNSETQNNASKSIRSSSLFREPSYSSAFSKPILPSSSSLVLSPKPQFGAPIGPTLDKSIKFGSSPNNNPTNTSTCIDTKYRECLRNHAASTGGHVTDGCGEFMPAGPTDPLKCAACGCHRSFHWKEPGPELTKNLIPLLPAPKLINGKNITEYHESSSGERIEFDTNKAYKLIAREMKAKRFRSKFSSEQKEKMKMYAERIGWRVQKKDESEMEIFCSEVGISRQVFKVWMHNNKHLIKNSNSYEEDEHIEGRDKKEERVKLHPQQSQERNGD